MKPHYRPFYAEIPSEFLSGLGDSEHRVISASLRGEWSDPLAQREAGPAVPLCLRVRAQGISGLVWNTVLLLCYFDRSLERVSLVINMVIKHETYEKLTL